MVSHTCHRLMEIVATNGAVYVTTVYINTLGECVIVFIGICDPRKVTPLLALQKYPYRKCLYHWLQRSRIISVCGALSPMAHQCTEDLMNM